MMNTILLTRIVTCLCALVTTLSLGAQTPVNSKVKSVTLFMKGAQVERVGQIRVPAGETKVSFKHLSPYIDAKSVQVKALGKVQILGVRTIVSTDSLTSVDKNPEIVRRQKELIVNKARIETIREEYDVLKQNSSMSGRTSGATLAAAKEMTAWFASEMLRLKKEEAALTQHNSVLAKELKALQQQFTTSELGRSGEVVVTLQASVATPVDFTLHYYVEHAGWYPSFEVRSGGVEQAITIVYKANITQNTGEKWTQIPVTLSSGNPMSGNASPILKPYRIGIWGTDYPNYTPSPRGNALYGTITDMEGEPIVGALLQVDGSTVGTVSDVNGSYSLVLPSGKATITTEFIGMKSVTFSATPGLRNILMESDDKVLNEVIVNGLSGKVSGVSDERNSSQAAGEPKFVIRGASSLPGTAALTVETNQNHADYTYKIAEVLTLEGGTAVRQVEIGRFEQPATYTYVILPRAGKQAYLTAKMSIPTTRSLLDGEANIFFDNTFVGTMLLDAGADTLQVAFGRDPSVVVERELVNTQTARNFIGTTVKETKTWQTTIKNNRAEPIAVTINDQIPLSTDKSITVEAEDLGGGSLEKETGYVRWYLTISPGSKVMLPLRYTVKYPRNARNIKVY